MMTNKTFRIDTDTVTDIVDLSYEERCSQGEVISRAIKEYRKAHKDAKSIGGPESVEMTDETEIL